MRVRVGVRIEGEVKIKFRVRVKAIINSVLGLGLGFSLGAGLNPTLPLTRIPRAHLRLRLALPTTCRLVPVPVALLQWPPGGLRVQDVPGLCAEGLMLPATMT